MIGARPFAIACDHEDCDGLDVPRFDPACGRPPESGRDPMSQPPMSRHENAPSWRAPARMGLSMIDLFRDGFTRVPSRIVLDTDDTVHGARRGSTLTMTGTAFSSFISSRPPPANRCGRCCVQARGLRARRRQESSGTYIGRIRRHGPRVEITVRGDGHDGTPEVMDLPEKQGCGYILGLAGNPRINKIGRPWGDDVAVRRARSCKDKVRRFFQTG